MSLLYIEQEKVRMHEYPTPWITLKNVGTSLAVCVFSKLNKNMCGCFHARPCLYFLKEYIIFGQINWYVCQNKCSDHQLSALLLRPCPFSQPLWHDRVRSNTKKMQSYTGCCLHCDGVPSCYVLPFIRKNRFRLPSDWSPTRLLSMFKVNVILIIDVETFTHHIRNGHRPRYTSRK